MEPILEQETPTPVSEEVVPPLRSEEEVAHHPSLSLDVEYPPNPPTSSDDTSSAEESESCLAEEKDIPTLCVYVNCMCRPNANAEPETDTVYVIRVNNETRGFCRTKHQADRYMEFLSNILTIRNLDCYHCESEKDTNTITIYGRFKFMGLFSYYSVLHTIVCQEIQNLYDPELASCASNM